MGFLSFLPRMPQLQHYQLLLWNYRPKENVPLVSLHHSNYQSNTKSPRTKRPEEINKLIMPTNLSKSGIAGYYEDRHRV